MKTQLGGRKQDRRGFLQSAAGCALTTGGLLASRNALASDQKNSSVFEHSGWRGELSDSGRWTRLEYLRNGQWHRIPFRTDEFGGPQWYGIWEGKTQVVNLRPASNGYEQTLGSMTFSLSYRPEKDRLAIVASLHNHGSATFRPTKAGLRLGIDTYMVKYPEWDENLFPSLIRCEKTHLWGYFMSPRGQIIGIVSPDPVASWSLSYEELVHRIFTANLDLMNAGPLPARHPQDLAELPPGQSKTWTIYLIPLVDLSDLKPTLAEACEAPMLKLGRHTLAGGESTSLRIWSKEKVMLEVRSPGGKLIPSPAVGAQGNRQDFRFIPIDEYGVYTLVAATPTGKQSKAKVYVRRPWSWYLIKARQEALRKPQKASTHMESWLGHFSTLLARRHFPDPNLDAQAEFNLCRILPLMFNRETGEQIYSVADVDEESRWRVQNSSAMSSLLATRYRAGGDLADLEFASRIADRIISQHQAADGSYRDNPRARGGGNHYTSVTYMAKYMLEVAATERDLGETSEVWQGRYARHLKSAQAAMDDLERRRDNVGTEGQPTFEDGMISCTGLQLAMFALLHKDPATRRKYTDAALDLMRKHQCVERLEIPDCRMHGATSRFWEAQYDVLMTPNMLDSPHGWTSWKTYGAWYLYLLTGEEEWLRQTMDTLGACMQSIEVTGGTLRWGFVPDPHVQARAFVPDAANPGMGVHVDRVVGEEYIPMISDWWLAPENQKTGGFWGPGGCCDNDVHEHFKCLEEVALTSAYLIERESGEIVSWNCSVKSGDGNLQVTPFENAVCRIHLNMKKSHNVVVHWSMGPSTHPEATTLGWIGPGGIPEAIRP